MGDGAGTIAADSSGYRDNGAVQGRASRVAGATGGSLRFDGATGVVKVPDAPQLEPAHAVSVSAWVMAAGSPGQYKYVLAKGGSGCSAASYGLYSGPDDGLQFYVSRARGSVYARSPDAGMAVWDGRWHVAVGTFDGITIRLYVDGREIGSGTRYPGPIEYLLRDSDELLIGDYPSCPGRSLNGSVADVQIWNHALSAAEVRDLAQPSGPTSSSGATASSPAAPAAAPGSAAVPAGLPTVGSLRLTPSTLTSASFAPGRRARPVISFIGSGSARVTFTILRLLATGANDRCANTRRGREAGHCPHASARARFTDGDHLGFNRLRFPYRLRLAIGRYWLEATPSAAGKIGETASVPFRVVASG